MQGEKIMYPMLRYTDSDGNIAGICVDLIRVIIISDTNDSHSTIITRNNVHIHCNDKAEDLIGRYNGLYFGKDPC